MNTQECPKGGAHEWSEENGEQFCSKCLEPKKGGAEVATKTKNAAKAKAEKPVKKAKADKPAKGKAKKAAPAPTKGKGAAAKPKAAKEPKAGKKAAEAKPKADKKLSALDAAALVLVDGKALSCSELVAEMAARKLWTSPGGKTPAATLNAAIHREIKTAGAASRFKAAGERGKFSRA